ncbi:outer membrane protein assembly factor BamE domain-containing protein [Dyella sp. 20L07]|uniref:outer membrane protein assembly factor BamE domain-containing protein n=1 Tax=Dyella sp. 20L07 TaxID=3384240 RepID=UPI003D29AD88
MKKILTTALFALVLTACVDTTTGVKMDTNKLDQLQAGTTTIEQAKSLLGEPTGVAKNPDGTTTLTYFYSKTGQDAKSYIPLAGNFLGKGTHESSMTFVQFDARGKYMKWWGGQG